MDPLGKGPGLSLPCGLVPLVLRGPTLGVLPRPLARDGLRRVLLLVAARRRQWLPASSPLPARAEWSMRGVVVPGPARPADLRAWYSGDRFPITSCLCRSQLWCPLSGVPAIGANPSGQVGAGRTARHDMPQRTHQQTVWPGGSGRGVKCPRMPGANSTVSRGTACRASWVTGGTGGDRGW